MGQDAVALLRIPWSALPKKRAARATERGDCLLYDTHSRFGSLTPDQHAAQVKEELGAAFALHDDPRGVLIFSDAYSPATHGYRSLVRELGGDRGDWGVAGGRVLPWPSRRPPSKVSGDAAAGGKLDAIVGVSSARVVDAIRREMASEGWTDGERGRGDDTRTVRVASARGGVAVFEENEDAPLECWAQRLARALETTGVTFRAYPYDGEFVVRRWDGVRCAGELSSGRDAPKHKPATFAFLSDLADGPRSRAALRKGFMIDSMRMRSALSDVAELLSFAVPPAGALALPRTKTLRFRRPAVAIFRAPPPTLGEVRIKESFHVRGVGSHDAMARVAKHLASEGRVAARGRETVRQAFFHYATGWTSFGEVCSKDRLEVCWPKILVRTLGVPVLVVRVDGSAVEVEIWSTAASPPVRRRWPDELEGSRGGSVRIDVAWLAPFLGAARQARVPVVIPNADTATLSRRALAAVAERLELASPILAGRLNGYRLAFAKPPRLRA